MEFRRSAACIFIALACLIAGFIIREPHDSVLHWWRDPSWWQVVVAVAGIAVISYQSFLTLRSVDVARVNADALIKSERAWIVPEVIPINARINGQWYRPAGEG